MEGFPPSISKLTELENVVRLLIIQFDFHVSDIIFLNLGLNEENSSLLNFTVKLVVFEFPMVATH